MRGATTQSLIDQKVQPESRSELSSESWIEPAKDDLAPVQSSSFSLSVRIPRLQAKA